MRPFSFRAASPAFLVAGLVLIAACGDPLGLPQPRFPNELDTLALYALDGTPLGLPGAYRIETGQAVRTDRDARFDVAFNVDAAGEPVLLPTGAVGLGRASGILLSTQPFDSIKIAPSGGYTDTLALPVAVGTVAVLRSRPVTCFGLTTLFYYAKLRVLAYDGAARRLDFEVLANTNCGYRGLEPGLPRR